MKERKGGRPLRWRLMWAMAGTVLGIWALLMGLLLLQTVEEMDNNLEQELHQDVMYFYNLPEDAWERERAFLNQYQSSITQGDAEAALVAVDSSGQRVAESSISWGEAVRADTGEVIQLNLDDLDREGQLNLAEWIVKKNKKIGKKWDTYELSRDAEVRKAEVRGRVDGNTIHVHQIILRLTNGGNDLMVDIGEEDTELETVPVDYLELSSRIAEWTETGEPAEREEMERHLQHFEMAQILVDRALRGEDVQWVDSVSVYLMQDYGQIYLGIFLSKSEIIWNRIGGTLIKSLLLALAVLLFLSRYLAKQVIQPLENLQRSTASGTKCTVLGPVREINQLADTFNRAQSQLKEDLTRERDLMRAVAHELKTPAAVLRSYAEGLQEDIAPDKREAYLRVLMEEADRTGKLVEDLLELTRIDSGKMPLRMEEVDLKALLSRVFSRYEQILAQKNGKLSLILDACTCFCDRRRMEQVADNLASNAVRFCTEGGTVTVRLRREGEGAAFTVDNDGPNIPVEAMERIFEPFYRGDWARDRESGGSGLGLALVKRILALHGGCCTAQNRKNGVLFTVKLPKHG